MRKSAIVTAAVMAASFGRTAHASGGELTGNWYTENGQRVSVERCGNAYCSTVRTGKYEGKRIAWVQGPGPKFEGKIVDPRVGKTYTGSMTPNGDTLDLEGCLMEIFCKSVQTWHRR